MNDILAMVQTKHKQIRGCKEVYDGAEIDHADVAIRLATTSIRFKHNIFIKGVSECTNIVTDEGFSALYCETLKYLVNDIISYENFNEYILKPG